MIRLFFALGAILAGVGVALGTFGAHGLANRLTPEQLGTYETGVRYHLYHALALLAVAFAISQWPGQAKLLQAGGWSFIAGILLFSGSLYILTLTGMRWLGAITPLGGVAFVIGWLLLAVSVLRS